MSSHEKTSGQTTSPAEEFQPYVPATESPAEFTFRSALIGIAFGILFGAANAYLGLKSGLTISTSIPIAVMTVAAFRVLARAGNKPSILEANISQTVGSASSSVASGVIFTLPALFLWGLEPHLMQMTALAACGGVLGILFMIPLRQFLIVREHHKLPYPEGTACAEVLQATQVGGAKAKSVFQGLGIGAVFKIFTEGLRIFPKEVSVALPLPKGAVGTEINAALFGVGFILGPRIGAIMVGGGLLSSVILIPAIAIWGAERTLPLYPETVDLIKDMSPGEIWTRYVRYIGAGAVATGGLLTLIRSIPTLVESFRIGAQELRERIGGNTGESQARTQQDLPLKVVMTLVVAIALVLGLIPGIFGQFDSVLLRLVAAFMVVVCAFFFVTVSSRIVGLVGVTSNPTSGMTIASLLATASVFLLFGWVDLTGKVAALTVGCVIAIAASIAGDTSQDLKTGFLLGGTPKKQQIGELLGVLTSATFVCLTLILLNNAYEFGSRDLAAPQATLMKVVIEGVLDDSLPWILVLIGVGIAILAELFRIPSLPFAVGVYLPVVTMVPVFLGGLIRWVVERNAASPADLEQRRSRGVLLGSGFVGGAGLVGVGIAGVAAVIQRKPEGIGYEWMHPLFAEFVAVAAFVLLISVFIRLSVGRR